MTNVVAERYLYTATPEKAIADIKPHYHGSTAQEAVSHGTGEQERGPVATDMLEAPSHFLSNNTSSSETATRDIDKDSGNDTRQYDYTKVKATAAAQDTHSVSASPPPTASLTSAFYPHQSPHFLANMSNFGQHYSIDHASSTATGQESAGHQDAMGAGGDDISPLQQHTSHHQHAYYSSSASLVPQSSQHSQHQASPYFSSGSNMASLLPSFPQQHDTQSSQSYLMQRPNTAMPLTSANSSALYTSARGLGLGTDSGLHDTLFSSVTQPRASMRLATAGCRPSGTGTDLSSGSRLGGSGNTTAGDDGESDDILAQRSTARRSSEDDLAQCQYTVTTEICLRARNGDRSADVWYPRAPNVMAIMSQLGEPYTNGTTALHFFAAAQHEREREQQLSASAGRQQYNYQQQQAQQQQSQPFYHTVQGAMGESDHTINPPPSSHGYGGMGGAAMPSRSTHASQVPQLPGALCYHPPPLEDFSHPNPHLRPRTQEERLRYPSDLYTPRWIRDEGAKREGWCSLCEQGQWLQLKTSQYWYHVKGAHGVNYHTGQIYDPPVQLRIFHDTCGTTHGLCGQCGDWVKIVTPRRKRNFASWFRHAQKCQRSQLPAGLFGFAPTPSMSGSVPGTAAGLPGSDGGSRGLETSSGTSGTFQHSMTGAGNALPPSSSHGTGSRDGDITSEGLGNANIFAEPRPSSMARSTRSWAMPSMGASPSTAATMGATVKSQGNGHDGSSTSPGTAALSLPPSPRSGNASRSISLQQQMYRHARTQPPSRDSSGQLTTSAGYATPQTYDDLTDISRGIRSAPHHVSTFQLGEGSHGYSSEGNANAVDMSSGLTSGHQHASNSISISNGSTSTPSGMSANQLIATSAGAAASAAVAAQTSSTYSALAGSSQHTFPALTTQSPQRTAAPVAAAWLA